MDKATIKRKHHRQAMGSTLWLHAMRPDSHTTSTFAGYCGRCGLMRTVMDKKCARCGSGILVFACDCGKYGCSGECGGVE